MVKCSNCGTEVVGSDFCFNCGEKVEKFEKDSDLCPKCGTKNNKNTNFCVGCGHRLANGPSVSFKEQEWNARRDEILDRYEKLAEEFGIKDEDYFLTSVRRFNKLEQGTSKHRALNALFTDRYLFDSSGIPFMNVSKAFGNETMIDGFFMLKDDKFVFMEIDTRDWKKVNAGINNFYFDKIVSMRVTLGLGDESRYEDITKRAPTSAHDVKRVIQNDIQSLKATRFKDLIANNDSADMFDRLLIKLVDNTFYEIRLPSYQFGQNLISLFESLRNQPQKVVIDNPNQQLSKAQQLKEFHELMESGAISQEEFEKLKKDLLFN